MARAGSMKLDEFAGKNILYCFRFMKGLLMG